MVALFNRRDICAPWLCKLLKGVFGREEWSEFIDGDWGSTGIGVRAATWRSRCSWCTNCLKNSELRDSRRGGQRQPNDIVS